MPSRKSSTPGPPKRTRKVSTSWGVMYLWPKRPFMFCQTFQGTRKSPSAEGAEDEGDTSKGCASLQALRLVFGNAALLHSSGVCVLGLEVDGAAAGEEALVVRLRCLRVDREKLSAAHVLDGAHGLRRLLNVCGTFYAVIIASGVYDLLKMQTVGPAYRALMLASGSVAALAVLPHRHPS